MSILQSSNPALDDVTLRGADWWNDQTVVEKATIAGIVNKTSLFAMTVAVSGAGGYALIQAQPWLMMPLIIVNLVMTLGVFMMIRGSATKARNLGFVYSVFQGLLLGGVAMMMDGMLVSRGITVAGGVAVQAFVVTIGCLGSMLMLYRAGILKGGPMFTRVISVATVGVLFAALISFVLTFFGIDTMLFNINTAFASGNGIWIGLGMTVFLLLLSSLWLIIDFRKAEELVASGAPKQAEWYVAFSLIITLAWIYYESLKLVFYLSAMMRR